MWQQVRLVVYHEKGLNFRDETTCVAYAPISFLSRNGKSYLEVSQFCLSVHQSRYRMKSTHWCCLSCHHLQTPYFSHAPVSVLIQPPIARFSITHTSTYWQVGWKGNLEMKGSKCQFSAPKRKWLWLRDTKHGPLCSACGGGHGTENPTSRSLLQPVEVETHI